MENTPCTYRVSVKAIIKDEQDRTMLIREIDGSWELPGGGLEHGEEPSLGLEREVREEIGLKVDKISTAPVAFWTINKDVGHPEKKWFAFVAYETEVSGELKVGNNEAQEAGYFSLEEAKKLPLHDNSKPFFENQQ